MLYIYIYISYLYIIYNHTYFKVIGRFAIDPLITPEGES